MHPNFIILYVKDPKTSAEFYSRLLETQPVEESPTFVMFAWQPGMMFGLWIRDGVAPSVAAMPGASELALSVEDRPRVEALRQKWAQAGVTVALEPTRLDFGYGFVALDPDGHRIRVFTPAES
ncbi:MAG TPA: VOC family protein [Spirochaetia bacterium]|nr:VOC family protein [Spirochaetia bacterium]